MTESTAQRAPLRFSLTVSRGLRESGAIALAVLALVICVALLSFDPRDPGFSTTGQGIGAGAQIHNRVGPIGAWLANALYFLFGRPAYLLPAIFGVAAWRLAHSSNDQTKTSRLNLAIRSDAPGSVPTVFVGRSPVVIPPKHNSMGALLARASQARSAHADGVGRCALEEIC